METAKLHIDDIRTAYPNPVRSSHCRAKDEYCVLGALCLYLCVAEEKHHFPGAYDATDVLLNLNPSLSYGEAYEKALRIIEVNDDGNFSKAWKLLKRAIEGE